MLQDPLNLGDQLPLLPNCPSFPLALQSEQYDNVMRCSIQMKLLTMTKQQSSELLANHHSTPVACQRIGPPCQPKTSTVTAIRKLDLDAAIHMIEL